MEPSFKWISSKPTQQAVLVTIIGICPLAKEWPLLPAASPWTIAVLTRMSLLRQQSGPRPDSLSASFLAARSLLGPTFRRSVNTLRPNRGPFPGYGQLPTPPRELKPPWGRHSKYCPRASGVHELVWASTRSWGAALIAEGRTLPEFCAARIADTFSPFGLGQVFEPLPCPSWRCLALSCRVSHEDLWMKPDRQVVEG